MRLTGYVAQKVAMRGTYKILVRKAEENRPLERPRARWRVAVNKWMVWIRFIVPGIGTSVELL
jgi:hypothetical protein